MLLLLWIEEPTKNDYKIAGVRPKFFYDGKKRFGLNMQAIVDNKRQFLDIDISHLGVSSDYFIFAVSNLKRRLEQRLLVSWKVIFGDNA